MQDRSEIGGAQALLSLGTKDTRADESPPGIESDNVAGEKHDGRTHDAGVNEDVTDLMDKDNQSLNDAVEAAVMRYVGGTLDTPEEMHAPSNNHAAEGHEGDGLSQKRSHLNHDDLISEYQWDKFLEEEVAAGLDRATPRKRRRKSFGNGNDIDPELADLDSSSEHDQLVHAAIMGAGELAKQYNSPMSQHRLHQQMALLQDRRAAGQLDDNEAAAIDHLAHAASALSNGLKGGRQGNLEGKRPLKKLSETPTDLNEQSLVPRSKYSHTSVEELVDQASHEACVWFNSQADAGVGGPRVFTPEEIQIVENFVQGYCQINNLSRMDICRRVWATDRPKDNFWESLTKVLPYRSRASVYKHIRRQYHVFEIRAKWTKEEDELLRKLAETSSANWKKIGAAMGRMPEDCRDRWRNYVKCGDNRASNKWSEEEERSLKDIVMEMITKESHNDRPISINWTLVSERMNGVRSRIQCRYKWNKLLRRESLSRVSMMDSSMKLWILNRIIESNVSTEEAIDWDYIVHMYHDLHKEKSKILWNSADFKVAFERMKATVRDNKSLQLHTILSKVVDSLYQSTVEQEKAMPADLLKKEYKQYEKLRPKDSDSNSKDERDAATVANAAVAAVSSGVSEQDAQHQEYSLWR